MTVDQDINTVTAATGAIIKCGPMVTAPPEAVTNDAELDQVGDSLNGPFVADLFAACITHERGGVNLFRMLGATTKNPMLQAQYAKMAGESQRAAEIWARLIRGVGGNEQYVSPPARLTETMDNKMVEAFQGMDSADPLSQEMAGVQATLMASALCVANAELLTKLGQNAKGETGQGLLATGEKLTAMAAEHRDWAVQMMSTMAITQAKHPVAQKAGQAMEKGFGKIKDALH
jgi:hypothetical protein